MHTTKEPIKYIEFNGKTILMLTNNYRGRPVIGYIPDYLISSKKIYEKYKNTFLVKIDEEKVIIIE